VYYRARSVRPDERIADLVASLDTARRIACSRAVTRLNLAWVLSVIPWSAFSPIQPFVRTFSGVADGWIVFARGWSIMSERTIWPHLTTRNGFRSADRIQLTLSSAFWTLSGPYIPDRDGTQPRDGHSI